jgi:hypothetical protein
MGHNQDALNLIEGLGKTTIELWVLHTMRTTSQLLIDVPKGVWFNNHL